MYSPIALKHVHKFRQSFLNQFWKCPESARRTNLGMGIETNSSDLIRGNAVHNAIESFGQIWSDNDQQPGLSDLLNWGVEEFEILSSEKHIHWRQSPQETFDAIEANLDIWYANILPLLRAPIAVEQKFEEMFYEDGTRKIYLTGTPDWVQVNDEGLVEIIDWKNPKTCPTNGPLWIEDRSNIQAMVYNWALKAQSFTLVYLSAPKTNIRRIPNRPENHQALLEMCVSIAVSLEANLTSLPQRWDSWYCDPNWCPHWTECRGVALGAEPFWKSETDLAKRQKLTMEKL